MTELTIKRIDPRKVINEVAFNLDKVSKLYGYKIPGPSEAKDLTEFVIKNFQTLKPSEIRTAFEMVSMQRLAVDIEAYGRILIIPILTKVLNAYKIHRNKEYQKARVSSRELKGEARDEANRKAKHYLLNQLEEEGSVIRVVHYKIIDDLVERFPVKLKQEAFKEAYIGEINRLKSIAPTTRDEFSSIRNILNRNDSIRDVMRGEEFDLKKALQNTDELTTTAKINAQITLAKRYIAESIIDYESARRRIENDEVLDSID